MQFVEIIMAIIGWTLQSLGVGLYFFIAFGFWYMFYGFETYINGGNLGRHVFLFCFKCFWEELFWYLPGGLKLRAAYIQERVINFEEGVICGSKRSWSYRAVRERNLYKECAKDVLHSPFYFWTFYVFMPAIWPLTIPLLLGFITLMLILNIILAPFESILEPLMDKYFAWKEKRYPDIR